jgi:hypothetical protein
MPRVDGPPIETLEPSLSSAGIFDGFLDTRQTQQDISTQAAWRGATRNRSSALPYDPASPASMSAYIDNSLGPQLLEELLVMRHCAYCRRHYRERDNIGQYQCSYHPEVAVQQSGLLVCCKNPLGSIGCRMADHRPALRVGDTMWTADDRVVRIPQAIAHRYKIADSAIVGFSNNRIDPVRSYLIVSRIGERRVEEMQ